MVFMISGTSIIEGTLSADGMPGTINVGGASGGSIQLHTSELEGSGLVTVSIQLEKSDLGRFIHFATRL